MKARVHVMLKSGVRDPQGRAVSEALRRLGHEVGEVRFGKLIELELPHTSDKALAREAIANMCKELLANPVIEDYRIEIVSGESVPD